MRIGFRIETSFIGSFQDLVHILIDLHFSGRRLPQVLAKRIEEVVPWSEIKSSDLRRIVRNPAEFWKFLQEQWERWVGPSSGGGLAELACPEVDFVEDRVRVWIDNLFLEGFLEPVPADQIKDALPQPWCQVGVGRGPSQNDSEELTRQRQHLLETIPERDADYQQWFKFAQAYSAHVAATFACDPGAADDDGFWRDLWKPMDEQFQGFARSRMESLGSLPPTRPTLVHHIARFLARRVKAERKVALLVLDGLSLAQWKAVRSALDEQLENILISDDACFTLVPSVTNICRQSIYAGELPVFFETTIERTDLDPKRWKSFWDSSCGRPVRSAHHNVEGRAGDLEIIRGSLDGNHRALGVTIRMPDEIVHGATMGWRGIFGQLQLWIQSGFLRDLIREVIASGFELYLTSDHGNIEAIGEGTPSQGVLVDRSGQRVRIYKNESILKQTEEELGPRARRWDGKLLPADYVPLIHQGRGAFTQQGKSLVCHGGSSLDELVVPFIQFSADTKS